MRREILGVQSKSSRSLFRITVDPAEAIQQGFRVTFVGHEDAAVDLDFVDRSQRHRKIEVAQGAVALAWFRPSARWPPWLGRR